MSGTCLTEYVNGLPSTIPPYHSEFGYLFPSRWCAGVFVLPRFLGRLEC